MRRYLIALAPLLAAASPQPVLNGDSISVTAHSGSSSATLPKLVPLSLLSFGAVCDGVTNDSAAVTAAIAAAKPIYIPSGLICNASSVSFSALAGTFVGPGVIKTSAGNKAAPLTSTLNAAPAASGSWSSILTAWNGSLGGVGAAHQHIVTGAATLGQPATGYTQTIEASGELQYTYNTSGWNQSLSGNDGRTGLAGKYMKIDNYGQGDATAMECFGIVASTLPSAAHYLASPAVECFGGVLYGGANGVYIEYLGDMGISDNGFDIAAVGTELNFSRSVATEAIYANWVADIRQSIGSKPIDAAYRVVGPLAVGIDLSSATTAYYRMGSLSSSAAGSGYVVGDVLTVSGGTSITPAKIKVATINGGGGVLTWTVVNTGIYTVPPVTTFTTVTLTGGTGTGASASAFFDLAPSLSLPSTGGCIKPSGGTGAVNTTLLGFYGSLCLTTAGITWGPLNSVPTAAGSSNVVLGPQNTLLGHDNYVFGTGVYDEAGIGASFYANGTFSGQGPGKAQTSKRILRGSNSIGVRLSTDQGAASVQNQYFVPTSSAHILSFRVECIDTTNADAAGWKLRNGFITRTAAGNAAYQGDASGATAPDWSTGAGNTASLIVAADTSLQTLNTTVTPPVTGNTWRCIQMLEGEQVQ